MGHAHSLDLVVNFLLQLRRYLGLYRHFCFLSRRRTRSYCVKVYSEALSHQKMNRVVTKFAKKEGVVIIVIGSSGKAWSASMREIFEKSETFYVNPDPTCISKTLDKSIAFFAMLLLDWKWCKICSMK